MEAGSTSYYVSLLGSDATGTGTIYCPFATITHAQSVAPAGSAVMIMDTPWPESFTYVNTNSYISYRAGSAVVLTGTVSSGGGSVKFGGIQFNQPINWTLTVPACQVSFRACNAATLTLTGKVSSISSLFYGCLDWSGSLTFVDVAPIIHLSTLVFSVAFSYQTTGLHQSVNAAFRASDIQGTVFLSSNGTAPNQANLFIQASSVIGTLTLNGAGALVTSTPGGFSATSLVLQNSAPYPVLVNGAGSVNYPPTTPANWLVAPSNAQSALDQLAAQSVSAVSASGSISCSISGHTLTCSGSGSSSVSCPAGWTCTISGGVLTITPTLTPTYTSVTTTQAFYNTHAAPFVFAYGPGLGTGPSCSLSGNTMAFYLTCTTGTSPSAIGDSLIELEFNGFSWPYVPSCVVKCTSIQCYAGAGFEYPVIVDTASTTSQFLFLRTIYTGTSLPLPASTSGLVWFIQCA